MSAERSPVRAPQRSPRPAEAFTVPAGERSGERAAVHGDGRGGGRSRDQVRSAEVALSVGTWLIVAGAVLYSVLTVTPLMAAHTPDGWTWTAPILPLVVDAAVVITVRLDAVLSRLGATGGAWPVLLRWMTGLMTLTLNTATSLLHRDAVGVGVHAVAPLLLIVTTEAGLAYRRAIARALAKQQAEREKAEAAARAAAARVEAERVAAEERRVREEREHQAAMLREQREHEAAMARAEADRRERAERAERERLDAERAARRAEHERAEAERAKRERAARAERERGERERAALLAAGPAPDKLPENDARAVCEAAFAEGLSVRAAAERCGWSVGWVSGRYRELRDGAGRRLQVVAGER